MKKNFLKVAALLIAAMLMVVSCTQEVAPVNNGLVEAKLVTTFGRDLTVGGGTDTSNLKLTYKMSPKWNNGVAIGSESISGIVSEEADLSKDSSLGWVTPGLWTVTVYAYEGTTRVFEGTNDAYFSSKNDKVTVYMKPVDTENNNLTFSILMQDLNTLGAGYTLQYSVIGTPGVTTTNTYTGTLKRSDAGNNVGLYQLAEDDNKLTNIPSDYYRITVSVFDGATLIGGITKGLFLANGDNGSVTGNIEPSDYINAQIDVKLIDVVTTINAGDVTYYSSADYKNETTADNSAKSASVVITLENNTVLNQYDSSIANLQPINKWYVDGVEVSSDNPNATITVSESNVVTLTLKDVKPGYKNVSCQTMYSLTDEDGVVYYWANTASTKVPFVGTKFAK